MRNFLAILLICSSAMLFAQGSPDFWKHISIEEVKITEGAERKQEPLAFVAFTLNYEEMVEYLKNAPLEFSAKAKQRSFLVTIPLADGSKTVFSVTKTHAMEAALEAQLPEIGVYSGEALNRPGMQLRITVTPGWAFNAMVLRPDKGVEYIQPIANGQNRYYMAYDRKDIVVDPLVAQIPVCKELHAEKHEPASEEAFQRFSIGEINPGAGEKLLSEPVDLKVYRLACSATGEFSQDNGGTKDLVFQKITTVVNQLNAIFERDINIRVLLIADSYNVIFLDPSTDPFINSTVDGWMNQNPGVLNQYLSSDGLYDIGHVFARYITGDAIGIASLSSCCTANKARGCSAGPNTYDDYFLGIAAHEMGHQWSAHHTFNQCNPGDQFSQIASCEPGGGNTILGYNSCGSNNTTGGRDLFYHACTISEIRQFVEADGGTTCGTTLATNNNTPNVSTPYPALTYIPVRTPFELTGSGSDPDGHPLTYTWDEIDTGPTSPIGSPMGDSPLFRWFEPSSSPTRTFPEIQKIIANINPVTEVLPTYDRNIRFSLVARDNQPNGGGVGSAQVALKSTTTAGPFLVVYPNTSGINWKIGEYQTVEWDVANTNNNLVNCQKVNIKLSLNNGLTYPVTLATDVPNTGKYCIVVPNNPSVNARVRVEAADNVFFDISNAAFTIAQSGTAGFSLCPGVAQGIVCLPGEYTSEISTLGLAGFADPIMLSATGLPAGATATFSPNPVMPGNSSLMTIQFAGNFTENTFGLTIQGNSGALTGSGLQTLTIVNNNYSAFAPLTPVNGATGVNAQPTMTWVAVPDADFYEIQVATNPSFDAGVMVHSKSGINADNYQVPLLLETGKLHYWRVRPVNDCGPGAWSEVQVFVVAVLTCVTVDATDLPKNISANGTPTIESVINFPNGGTINDVNVKKIQGNHTFFKDLEVHLIGPSGTDVLLWKDKCPNNISFNFGIDDVAAAPFNCPPPNNGLAYKPASPLSAFNGQNAAGNWILRVKDNVISSGGSLAAFSLELCSNAALNPPTIITNLPLALPSGNNAAITDLLLLAQDPNNGPGELVFTLMNVPAHGELLVNGVTATPGTQFTQADVNNGVIRYYDFGLNLGADSFNFSLSDGNGGMASGTFLIQPTVGSHQPESLILIEIAPNPANSHALLSLTQALEMDARVTMFNTAGQVIGNWTMEAGTTMLKLNLNHLPSGIYLVSVETTDGKTLKKLVKR